MAISGAEIPTPATGGRKPEPLFNRTTIAFYIAAVVAVVLVLVLRGREALGEALWEAIKIAAFVAPMVVAGLFLGGLARSMIDPAKITPILGKESGWRGLWLATLLGIITPGGPYTAFPIVYALYISGADIGATIAYVTAWCMMGVQRLVNWEIPFLGADFVIVRMIATTPFVILAAALARYLSKTWLTVPSAKEMEDSRR